MQIKKTKKAKKLLAPVSAKLLAEMSDEAPITSTDKMVNVGKKMAVLERRAAIANLLPRGYSYAELSLHLKKEGFCEGGCKAVSESLIKADITAIEGYWKEVCAQKVDTHRARQLMELTRLKTSAYEAHDLELVLKVLSKEMDLLGTKTAVKEADSGNKSTTIYDFRQQAISLDQRDKLALDILNAARKRADAPNNADKNSVGAAAETERGV